MSILDACIIIPIIWGAYKGFKKGFIIEVFSFLALILGIACSFKFAHLATAYLQDHFDINSLLLPFISFILVFVGVVILVFSIAKLIDKFLKIIALGFVNKCAGGLFSLLKYAFMVSIILWLCSQVNLINPETKAHSLLYSYVEPFAPRIINSLSLVIPGIGELMESIDQMFLNLTEKEMLV